ncbi:MAG TPA: hypothetical protein VJ083_08995 [Sedimentibacter sp.]|nr:hypothetical protein [Sedimentibacter sp.]
MKLTLEHLPKRNSGIDWFKSIGNHVIVNANKKDYVVNIIDYNKDISKITIEYNGNIKSLSVSQFRYGNFKKFLGVKGDYKPQKIRLNSRKPHKYNIGDILYDKNFNAFEIIEKLRDTFIRKNNEKIYKYHCNVCGDEDYLSEYRIINEKLGCKVCSNKKIKKGFNDIWTTNPELAKLLANPEDGYLYSSKSGIKVDWLCVNCSNVIKAKRISDIKRRGVSCPRCSDGISYPNKIMYNILTQLNINFEYEKSFSWSRKIKRIRYDFYIDNISSIIEVNGRQHYEDSLFSLIGGYTTEEQQENDFMKYKLAKENNIGYYIVIDAKKSELEYIKNSILNSDLPRLLKFNESDIDWLLCDKQATHSMVIKVGEIFNTISKNTTDISNITKLAPCTVRNYLHITNKLGITNYIPTYYSERGIKKASEAKEKEIKCLSTGDVFNSIKEAGIKYNINLYNMSRHLKGISKYCGVLQDGTKLKWELVKDNIEL